MRKLTALAAASAVLIASCSAPPEPADRRVPGALRRLGSCRAVLDYLKREALETVYHGGLPGYATPLVLVPPNPLGETDDTEPDIVKVDGDRIFALGGGRLHYMRNVDGIPRQVGTLRLSAGTERRLIVIGDRVVISSAIGMQLVDVSNPAAMRTEWFLRGVRSPRDVRLVGGKLRVVASTSIGIPLPFDQAKTNTERTVINRAVIRRSTLADWFPEYELRRTGRRVARGSLVACGSVHAPEQVSGFDLVSVISIDPDDPVPRTNLAVLAHPHMLHASVRTLVLGTQGLPPDWRRGQHHGVVDLHEVDVSDPDGPRYIASTRRQEAPFEPLGAAWPSVTGDPDDLWIVTMPRAESLRTPPGLTLSAFRRRDGRLQTIGSVRLRDVRGLRFDGSFAELLTARDEPSPEWTLSLAHLAGGRQRVVGRARLPSGFLRAIDGRRFVGLDVSEPDPHTSPIPPPAFRFFVVDMSDPTAPRVRLSRTFGPIRLPSFFYPSEFTYLAAPKLLFLGGGEVKEVFRLDGSTVNRVGRLDLGRTLKVFAVGNGVYAISPTGLLAIDGDTLSRRGSVRFR